MTHLPADFRQFDLAQWLEYIQRQHWRTIEMELDRISDVWRRLDGQCSRLVFTVAGTNGKGSCVAMLESVLRHSGLKTGSYTSPHLVRYNERVCIDGQPASDGLLIDAFCEIEQARGKIPLTYFEFGTLLALRVFQMEKVDVSILETGMGGRLDAVNMVANDVALITSVGLDHQQWLGDDVETIAREKAGIINNGGRAVFASGEMPDAIAEGAENAGAMLWKSGRDFEIKPESNTGFWRFVVTNPDVAADWRNISGLQPPFIGRHQIQNLGGVIASLAMTAEHTGVRPEHLGPGLEQTTIIARCQIIDRSPLTVLDVAHNEGSANELAAFLESHPVDGGTHAVFGVLEDKDLMSILGAISPLVDVWHLATLTGERGRTSAELGQKLLALWPQANCNEYDSPVSAWEGAKAYLRGTDRLIIFGSFYTVGDILASLESG